MSMFGYWLKPAAWTATIVGGMSLVFAFPHEWKSGILWPEPVVTDPGLPGGVPADAVVLFDGADLSKWKNGEKWEIKDGVATSRQTGIETKDAFGDCQLHLEFATPAEVKGSGQGRGNSGVFLMGKYEVQILDSFENETYFDGQCAAIYKQTPPLVNACRKPGEWQTYDILFEAPHFDDDGHVSQPACVTVLQNGVVVQNHFQLLGGTAYDHPPSYHKHADRLPIQLQFHGNPVQFRNIWIRELKPMLGQAPAETVVELPAGTKKDDAKKDDAKPDGETKKGPPDGAKKDGAKQDKSKADAKPKDSKQKGQNDQ